MSSKVSRNIITLVGSRIFAAVLVFVGYASLFRYLGTYVSGQHQFVLSFVTLFSVIADLGIQQLVIKKVSENLSESKKYLGTFFAVEFFLALALWLVLILIAFSGHYEPGVRNAMILAGFGMFLNAITVPHTSILSAHQDMKLIAAVNFLDSVVNVSIMFAAIFLHYHVVFLASVQAINGLLHILIYNHLIKRYVEKPDLLDHLRNLDLQLVKKMFLAALPFGMLIGFSVIYNKIDVIIVRELRGYGETGLYTAAYKFMDFLAFVPAVVTSSLYPFFSAQLKAGDTVSVKNALQNYTRIMIALGMPIAFGGFVLASKLIVVVGGDQFIEGASALRILVFASGVLFCYAAVNGIMVNQLTRLAVKITFANIFINVIGNLILIPIIGFKGAAMITLASESIQALAYFYFVRKKIVQFHVFRYFFQPIVASLIMALVLWQIKDYTLALTIPAGILVYFVAIFAVGFFKRSDLAMVKKLVSAQR